jgi:hypothetical protein
MTRLNLMSRRNRTIRFLLYAALFYVASISCAKLGLVSLTPTEVGALGSPDFDSALFSSVVPLAFVSLLFYSCKSPTRDNLVAAIGGAKIKLLLFVIVLISSFRVLMSAAVILAYLYLLSVTNQSGDYSNMLLMSFIGLEFCIHALNVSAIVNRAANIKYQEKK